MDNRTLAAVDGALPTVDGALIDRLLNQALILADDTRMRIGAGGEGTSIERLEQSLELTRITARVVYGIAYLLERKALLNGEALIDATTLELPAEPDWQAEGKADLDPTTLSLARRSRTLYARLSRLAQSAPA